MYNNGPQTRTIRVRANQLTNYQAIEIVQATYGTGIEIDDTVAVTIASWWQSSGNVGSAFAALASGSPVTVADVLGDIRNTRIQTQDDLNHKALDLLASWTLNREPYISPQALRSLLPSLKGRSPWIPGVVFQTHKGLADALLSLIHQRAQELDDQEAAQTDPPPDL